MAGENKIWLLVSAAAIVILFLIASLSFPFPVSSSNPVYVASAVSQSGAISSLTAYTPSTNQVVHVGGALDLTSVTAGSVTLQVTYTDWAGTGTTTTLTTASALGDSSANSITIMAKSGTTVTISTTTTTFTGAYNVAGWIQGLS